jgi:hypothetical protein
MTKSSGRWFRPAGLFSEAKPLDRCLTLINTFPGRKRLLDGPPPGAGGLGLH